MQGLLGAESEKAVVVKLEQMGYIPISILLSKTDQAFDVFWDIF